MRRILSLLAASAVLFTAAPAFADAGGPYKLDAKGKCHDMKGGFVAGAKCKAPAMTPMATSATSAGKTASTTARTTTARTGGHPTCKKGKPCGNSCIAMDKVCHK